MILIRFFIPCKFNENKTFEDIVILQFNIYWKNKNAMRFIDWIHKLHSPEFQKKINIPHIIIIQEVTPEMEMELASITTLYPHIMLPVTFLKDEISSHIQPFFQDNDGPLN